MPQRNDRTKYYHAVPCPKCGALNQINAHYCISCGKSLTGTPSKKGVTFRISGAGLRQDNIKDTISKIFEYSIIVGWGLLSVFSAFWAYALLATMGLTAVVLSVLLFAHLFGPLIIWRGFVKRESYGVFVFAVWIILSLCNAASIYVLSLGLGLLGSLVTTALAWIILMVIYAYLNRMVFGFPDIPKTLDNIVHELARYGSHF
jgi:hypothetical protein